MKISGLRLAFLIAELLIGLIGAYLSIFELTGQASAATAFCTLVYGVITLKLEAHFSAEDRLFAKFPILHSLQSTEVDAELLETMSSFHAISHPLLHRIKASVWREFAAEVKSLHTSKRSESINPAEYIDLIQTELARTRTGDRVIAVSLYGPDEFFDNNFERNFHDAQLKAIERGTSIERIFICARSRMEDLKSTPYWSAHLGTIDARFAEEAEVESSGIKVRYGFILISDALFDDRPQQRGLSGVVSTNALDIERARKDFASLERLARPLSEIFGAN